jgi:hypothetical protein
MSKFDDDDFSFFPIYDKLESPADEYDIVFKRGIKAAQKHLQSLGLSYAADSLNDLLNSSEY